MSEDRYVLEGIDLLRAIVQDRGLPEGIAAMRDLEEQFESEQKLRRLADAALEAVGGELERTIAERNDLRECIQKLAGWYGHDLTAALGSSPAVTRIDRATITSTDQHGNPAVRIEESGPAERA